QNTPINPVSLALPPQLVAALILQSAIAPIGVTKSQISLWRNPPLLQPQGHHHHHLACLSSAAASTPRSAMPLGLTLRDVKMTFHFLQMDTIQPTHGQQMCPATLTNGAAPLETVQCLTFHLLY
uniref:Uncharacterized protein n=1 Tax=Romanomermis culicivorax TaxID=13658 RepID=A0A915J0V3_ROMCU